ncbi:hypothetical protein BOX15_Mlig010228g1 [Macrostomum lignano]|uniref:Alpha-1,4-N-acetylglucosaminyltransferase n=1 Tax=Macrostomum lignano TaxID=282301 RepID=A0A267GLN3_9PLAT|nr:hypothetical protein BOX15_Mlig010228g1 [Macrostomum lignano]
MERQLEVLLSRLGVAPVDRPGQRGSGARPLRLVSAGLQRPEVQHREGRPGQVFFLYHFGGIYTDLDTVCMKNFEHLLHLETLVFGAMDTHPGDSVLPGQLVQNSFMASLRPGHPFWMRLLRRIERNFNAGKRGRPEDNTGPTVLMEELRLYVRSNASDVKVYPGKYFNPFSWTLRNSKICKDFGQMSDSVEKICINSFPKAFVVQLHTQSWGRGRMR